MGSAPQAGWAIVWAGLVGGLVVGGLFAAFLLGRSGPPTDRRRDGSLVLPAVGIDFAYWTIDPLVDRLDRLGFRPNHVTAFSLYVAALTGLVLAAGRPMTGFWLLGLTGLCDLVDGHLARRRQLDSPAGAFFDSFADRVAEAFVFGGLAYWGAGGWLTWLAIWALFASLAVSYARARGESLGAAGAVGLMQRPERMVLLGVTLFAAPLVAIGLGGSAQLPATIGVGLLALLASVTAVRRAHSIFVQLRERQAPASRTTSRRPLLDHGREANE